MGKKTVEPCEMLPDKLERLRQQTDKNGVLQDIPSRMTAGWVLDKIIGENPIELPGKSPGQHELKRQKLEGLSVVGADVCSLFPSLPNVETARMARKAVLASNVEFVDFDYIKALRYIKIN